MRKFLLVCSVILVCFLCKSQAAKEDTITIMVGAAEFSIENCAKLQKEVTKHDGVTVKFICTNHHVFIITSPRAAYKTESQFFGFLQAEFPDMQLYFKHGSITEIENDCRQFSPADRIKFEKLKNN